MSGSFDVVLIVFASALFIFPAFYFFIYEPVRILIRWIKGLSQRQLDPNDQLFLSKNFPFYHNLSQEMKSRFDSRVSSFLRNKKFTGIDIEITDEMKLLTAACAIQLTFGLRNFWLTEFDEFRLISDKYNLPHIQQKVLGHVSNRGVVTLSWADMQKGFQNNTDGLNVGLHEMAHALYLSSVEKGWNLSFAVEYGDYEKEAIIEWKKRRQGGENSVREYGYTNLYEFFAVCVEYFFEKPNQLKDSAPKMFYQMEKLLRLNPLEAANPVLASTKILYPPQAIPLPKYGPVGLLEKVFSNTKTILNFSVGVICFSAAISIFFVVLRYQHFHPEQPEAYSMYNVYGVILLFASGYFFIQTSGD